MSSGAIDLSLPNSDIARIFGPSGSRPYRGQVASGDFNNDGYDDILIGEPYSPPPFGEGVAYVVFGSSSFPDTFDIQTRSEDVLTMYGGQPYDGTHMGWRVCACDMNGDGYDEIVTSAPDAFPYGEVYVVHGTDSLPTTLSFWQAPAGVTRIIDNENTNATGSGLVCTDIDEDGYDDLIVGSPPGLQENLGSISIVYGSAHLPDSIQLGDSSYLTKHILGENPGDSFGKSIAVGDVDCNGGADVIVSAPQSSPLGCSQCGEVYIFFDIQELPDSISAGTTEHPISRILGSGSNRLLGLWLHCDDMTGDGYDDVAIVARGLLGDPFSFDKTVIVYGIGALPDSVFLASDTTITTIIAAAEDDGLGSGRTSGDFNKDGVTDLILGADWNDSLGRQNAGSVYLFYGVMDPTGIVPSTAPPMVLQQNHPNPFNPSTTISFTMPARAQVSLSIYDVQGKLVATLLDKTLAPGPNQIRWDGRGANGNAVGSGVYFYRLVVGGRALTKKMVVLK